MTFCRTWCQRKPFLVRFPLGKSRLIMLLKQKSGKKVSQLTSKTVYWITLKCTLTSKASISWYFQVVKPLLCVSHLPSLLVFFAASISEAKDITRAQFANRKEPNELFFWFSNLGKSILEQFSWTRIERKYISVFCPLGIFFQKAQ